MKHLTKIKDSCFHFDISLNTKKSLPLKYSFIRIFNL